MKIMKQLALNYSLNNSHIRARKQLIGIDKPEYNRHKFNCDIEHTPNISIKRKSVFTMG